MNDSSSFTHYIVTAHAEFLSLAFAELRRLDTSVEQEKLLDVTMMLVHVKDSQVFLKALQSNPPVFVQHIAPVQIEVPTPQSLAQLNTLLDVLMHQQSWLLFDVDVPFSIQIRMLSSNVEYSSGMLHAKLAEHITSFTGSIESVKYPQVVVSILCTSTMLYAGISRVAENLSVWNGGAPRFAKSSETLSRAEFKLLEAFEVFSIATQTGMRVLDLGAAPGGWSRILLEHGASVVAVDPANMSSTLHNHKGFEHVKDKAEYFVPHAIQQKQKYDAILNDIRMDARDAARLLVQAYPLLAKKGWMLSSLKLPHATATYRPEDNMYAALRILSTVYTTVRAHQLFHNRQEITVFAQKL